MAPKLAHRLSLAVLPEDFSPASVVDANSSQMSVNSNSGGVGGGSSSLPFAGAGTTASLLERHAQRQIAHDRLHKRYEALLDKMAQKEAQASDGATTISEAERTASVNELRRLVLLEGLPDTQHVNSAESRDACSLRGRVWKILVGVRDVDAELYLDLVKQEESKLYQKIRNDSFRTFKTDRNFSQRVPEVQLIRLLNAFLHYVDRGTGSSDKPCDAGDHDERHVIPKVDEQLSYVQGMNVIAAPFLYVMPEVDAFFAFARFITFHTPRYYYSTIDGAYEGLKLMDQVLECTDKELYAHLKGKGLTASVYAMPPILGYSASSPPLDQLLRLWDFYLAFGAHMNVIATVARIVLMREKLLASPQPMRYLGAQMPPLKADPTVNLSVVLVQQLPEDLYQRLCTHTYSKQAPIPTRSAAHEIIEHKGGTAPRSSRGTPVRPKEAGSKHATLPRGFRPKGAETVLSGAASSASENAVTPAPTPAKKSAGGSVGGSATSSPAPKSGRNRKRR